MKPSICPNCFAESEGKTYLCSNPGCEREGKPVPAGEARKNGENLACPGCGRELSVQVCAQCGYEMRGKEEQGENLPISIVGVHGSGKSHYLAVLIDQIKGAMAKTWNSTLYPLGSDEMMEHFNRTYHRPLFELGRCLDSTEQVDVRPLRYRLTLPAGKNGKKAWNLSFYDACGNNFESEREMKQYNRSVYHSKGILFFVDPSQFPVIRDRQLAKNEPVCEGNPVDLLVRTLHLLRSGLNLEGSDKKLEIPLAVCVTKMDTLYDTLDPSSFLKASSRQLLRPALDKSDLSCCNHETQSLIESWGGGELISMVKAQVRQSCFFGVSALGARPNEDQLISRVSPHRVLDPLFWLLWKNGVLG